MSHRHFTIVFALVFITVHFEPIFVLFVAISMSYVAKAMSHVRILS